MRLWHKDLISALPRQQLVAQWRELSSIATNIRTKGTPNHILVNKIMDYPLDHFISYATLIRVEMMTRGYKTMDRVWNNICSVTDSYNLLPFSEIYSEWHNYKYYVQCYCNLEEKYDCGGIEEKDWEKIKHPMLYAQEKYYWVGFGA